MKKVIALLLAIVLCLGMAACKREQPVSTDESSLATGNSATVATNEPQIQAGTLPPDYTDATGIPEATYENGTTYKAFGGPYEVEITNEKGTATFTVNIPSCNPKSYDTEYLALQTTNNFDDIYIDNASLYADIDSLENVFSLIEENIQSKVFNPFWDEASLKVKESEIVQFNGVQFAKVRYNMRFSINGTESSYAVFGYATQLDNGAYVFWLVYKGNDYNTTRMVAENMAMTFQELTAG